MITLPGLLGLLFITLKLTHVIDWLWIWVLAPFWMGLAVWVVVLLVGIVVVAVKTRRETKRR
jgi:hypothetical protein